MNNDETRLDDTRLYDEPIYSDTPREQKPAKKDNTGKIAAAAGGFVAGAALGATGGVMAANSDDSSEANNETGDVAKVANVTGNAQANADASQVVQQTITSGDQSLVTKQEIHIGPNGEQIISTTTTQEIHTAPKVEHIAQVNTVHENVTVEQHIITDYQGSIKFAHITADNFHDAFAQARAQLGPGGAFEYNGKIYGTYYRTEWNHMSHDQRLAFQHEAMRIAPSHHDDIHVTHNTYNTYNTYNTSPRHNDVVDHTPHASNHHGHSHPVVYGHGDIPFAQVDARSFSEAFAQARAQVGPGGAFEYNGKVYGTYYRDEWNQMSHSDRHAFSTAAVQQAHDNPFDSIDNNRFDYAEAHVEHNVYDTNASEVDPYDDGVHVIGTEPDYDDNSMNGSFPGNEDSDSMFVEVEDGGTLEVAPAEDYDTPFYANNNEPEIQPQADDYSSNNSYDDSYDYQQEVPSYEEAPDNSWDNNYMASNDDAGMYDGMDDNYDFDNNVMDA